MQFTKVHQELAKPVYEAIPKIAGKAGKKWEWEPERGQWCFGLAWSRPDVPLLITEAKKDFVQINCKYDRDYPKTDFIPLLHWEDHLEPTLEEFGWVLWDMKRTVPSSDGTGSLVVVKLAKGGSVRRGQGKDRQEAFQRAVLAVIEQPEAREEV